DRDKANAVLKELLDAPSAPRDETRHAWALLQIAQQRWNDARQALEAIPEERRTPEQQRLLTLAAGQWQYQRALNALSRSERETASTLAASMKPLATRSPLIALLHADLLLRLGDRKQALDEARDAVAQLEESDTGMRLKYADMLRRAEQWEALDALLSKLDQSPWLDGEQQKTIRQIRLGAALTQSRQWLARQQPARSLAVLTPLAGDFNNTIDFQMALAASRQALGQPAKALSLYQTVLKRQPDNLDAASGAYGAALTLRDYRTAETITRNALRQRPDEPRLLLQQARLDLMRGDKADARQRLRTAIDQLDHASASDRALSTTGHTLLAQASGEPLPTVGAGLAFRSRGEQDGLDKLEEQVLPLGGTLALNDRIRLAIDLDYLRLDAGPLPASQADRYGSLILGNATNPGAVLRSVEGPRAGLALSSDHWRADLSVLPDDFPVRQLSGGLTWEHRDYGYSLVASLFHRPVRESLLAYAGATDPATGLDWGGVARSGASISYTLPTDGATLYSRLRLDTVRGKRTPDNSEIALDGSLRWPLIDRDHEKASLGVQVAFRDFQRNLGEFTLGHGGYFSPSNYLALSLPASYEKTEGKLGYRLEGSIGLQRYRRNPSPAFPGHTGLQQQLNAVASGDSNINTRTALAENNSAVYTLGGEIGYSPDKRLFLGVWASLNKTDNFKESAGGVFLRYLWNPASLEKTLPATKFEPPEVW
ncbi:MAG TPA: hypothetical protein ENK26_14500, partial [Gammaproteobacteria bacterium]|nr:hypothetical protein [Gammaproteobacteria bacterium]